MRNILFVATALIIIGVMGCGQEKPLEQINWVDDLGSAMDTEKPILIDFWRDG